MNTQSTIFVVDDDAGMVKSVERLLRAHGFNVAAFTSVDDLRCHAELNEISCLILDVHLNGMSGIEWRYQLARSGLTTPVIFITADDCELTRNAALEVGCVAYLRKPFAAKLLVEAVKSALASRSGAD